MIAGVLAEASFKDLFRGLYNEIAESPQPAPLPAPYQRQVDPDRHLEAFDAYGRRSQLNIGQGLNTVRFQTLQNIKETAGPGNDPAAVQARQPRRRLAPIPRFITDPCRRCPTSRTSAGCFADPASPGDRRRYAAQPKRTRRHDGGGQSPIREGQVHKTAQALT